jgi:hypothetical protein
MHAAAGAAAGAPAGPPNPVQQPEELVTIVDEQNNVVRAHTLRQQLRGVMRRTR